MACMQVGGLEHVGADSPSLLYSVSALLRLGAFAESASLIFLFCRLLFVIYLVFGSVTRHNLPNLLVLCTAVLYFDPYAHA